MNDFMKTILNAIQSWTKKEIKNSTSDWNQNDVNQPGYVKNRTHWDSRKEEEVNITFDGNIDGKEYIDLQGDGSIYFVKVSDLTPSTKEVIGGTISGTEMGNTVNTEITEYDVISDSEVIYYIAMTDNSRAIVVFEDFIEDNITLTKGIWFFYAPNVICINILSYDAISGELKKIDEKYLPEIDISSKMDRDNPVGTGSFSMNRKAGTTVGEYSHAEGYNITASGENSHAEGYSTIAAASGTARSTTSTTAGYAAHAEGYGSVATGAVSHAEGNGTTASGKYSHSEGVDTKASGSHSHAEGGYTHAEGSHSHAEGGNTHAEGVSSHAEGQYTHAKGWSSHAEGERTHAEGSYSHAEGSHSHAEGPYAHAEGQYTHAEGYYSHAEGNYTHATGSAQHVQGAYNQIDPEYDANDQFKRNKYVHIVGNGTNDTARSNAHTLDWNGVGWFQGGLQVGGNAQDDGAKNVLLEGDAIPTPSTATVGQTIVVKSVDENGKPTEWEAVDIERPSMTQITLTTANWNDTTKSQTIAVTGILADTTAQNIQINPIPTSMYYAIESGIYCSAQAENSLTFSCSVVPTEDIVINIIWQDVNYIS